MPDWKAEIGERLVGLRLTPTMHDEAVSLFEREAGGSKDPDLKAFAARTLPTLREHRQMARDISTKVGAVAKAANKT